jgi:ribosomal-protein-alanine N-acetyltransferase
VLLGFTVVLCAGPEWEIENLAVADPFRRSGLATRLLRSVVLRARRAHVGSIVLEVRASNFAARQLYEKSGFSATGNRTAYYSDPDEDAISYRFEFCRP